MALNHIVHGQPPSVQSHAVQGAAPSFMMHPNHANRGQLLYPPTCTGQYLHAVLIRQLNLLLLQQCAATVLEANDHVTMFQAENHATVLKADSHATTFEADETLNDTGCGQSSI
eukprot:scaffold318719_cov86-Cyclotella_meneghiniana.AAC.1